LTIKSLGVGAGAVALILALVVVALFRGCFDHGTFEVTSVAWANPTRAAIVARRSDHDALNSDQYFVFVDNHVPSPRELRATLYSSRPVFDTANPCVTARWRDASHLIVSCRDAVISPTEINFQGHRTGDVTVEYEAVLGK
jgi:hypothetical protein